MDDKKLDTFRFAEMMIGYTIVKKDLGAATVLLVTQSAAMLAATWLTKSDPTLALLILSLAPFVTGLAFWIRGFQKSIGLKATWREMKYADRREINLLMEDMNAWQTAREKKS